MDALHQVQAWGDRSRCARQRHHEDLWCQFLLTSDLQTCFKVETLHRKDLDMSSVVVDTSGPWRWRVYRGPVPPSESLQRWYLAVPRSGTMSLWRLRLSAAQKTNRDFGGKQRCGFLTRDWMQYSTWNTRCEIKCLLANQLCWRRHAEKKRRDHFYVLFLKGWIFFYVPR